MKWTLRFFALLDLFSFFFMFAQGTLQLQSLFTSESFTITEIFSRFMFLAVWISLIASSILLAIPKKAGILVYYFQLLPRIIFLAFSFGFISFLSYIPAFQALENILMSVIVFMEMLRVYWTYQIQKKLF